MVKVYIENKCAIGLLSLNSSLSLVKTIASCIYWIIWKVLNKLIPL